MTNLGEAIIMHATRWLFLPYIKGVLQRYQLSWFLLRCLLEEYIHLYIHLRSEQLSSIFLYVNQERIIYGKGKLESVIS